MAISLKQSLHLPSPGLFQRNEISPVPPVTYIAKLTELQQSLICTSGLLLSGTKGADCLQGEGTSVQGELRVMAWQEGQPTGKYPRQASRAG